VRKFHGTKVLGTFAPEERKFHRSESSMERKFLDFSLPGSECSTERKFHGSESSLYGLFAPGNESAEERKGQLPNTELRQHFFTDRIINLWNSLDEQIVSSTSLNCFKNGLELMGHVQSCFGYSSPEAEPVPPSGEASTW